MQILLLCDRFPFPLQNGQNLRIFHYVRQLQSRHTFDLLCYGKGAAPLEIQPLFRSIEVFEQPPIEPARGFRRLREAFDVALLMPSSEPVRAHVAKIFAQRRYDLIWVSGWDMILNLPRPCPLPLLADMVDDGVLEYRRELAAARTPLQFARQLKWLAMNWLFERRYFAPADEVVLVADKDAQVFARVCPGTSVSAINNGVDADYFAPPASSPAAMQLVFEGNVSFGPNVDGVMYFCQSILPLILAQLPEVRFTIVGKDPSPEVLALACNEVEVTGYVTDIRPYLACASVFVCPLRKGAGIKNKILQAWAMAKAVVATPAAVGGLRLQEGENIMVRGEPAAFAEAVLQLLRDPALRDRIGAAARDTVSRHYTWQAKAGELEAVMLRASLRKRPSHSLLKESHA